MPACRSNAVTPEVASIDEAVGVLRRGGLVVYPTETLYGLGSDAGSEAALRRLVEVKGREVGKPIALLVSDAEMAASLFDGVPALARTLMETFWPGPLTLCLPARSSVSAILTGGGRTIGARVSSCPLATELVRALGTPLTSPSANPAGHPPPVDLAAAQGYFGDGVDCYLDGGVLPGEPASTVVEIVDDRILIRRHGAVPESSLAAFAAIVR